MRRLLFWPFILALALSGCASKEPQAPPQELLDEIAAAKSAIEKCETISPGEAPLESARDYLAQAESLLQQGDYAQALEKARLARLHATRAKAELKRRQLLSYHVSPSLTYHYRQRMRESEEAEKRGDLLVAIAKAEEAAKQAELGIQLQQQCLEECKARLEKIKEQLELIFKPPLDMVNLYWDAVESLPAKNCEKTKAMVDKLQQEVSEYQRTTIPAMKVFYVYATEEYLRTYGDPYMYAEVTEKGLKNPVGQVAVGTPVYFIRAKFVSRGRTYYYVEDSTTGMKGWMAEERVWPERAARK